MEILTSTCVLIIARLLFHDGNTRAGGNREKGRMVVIGAFPENKIFLKTGHMQI